MGWQRSALLGLRCDASAYCKGASSSSRSGEVSCCGIRYSSAAQAPKSIVLQRLEQKGRSGLSVLHATDLPQAGHWTCRDVAALLVCSVMTQWGLEVTEGEFEGDVFFGLTGA